MAANNDYWIAEADMEGGAPEGAEADPEGVVFEPRGQGVNQFNYFVATDGEHRFR